MQSKNTINSLQRCTLHQPSEPCPVLLVQSPPQGHRMSMLQEEQWSLMPTVWECCPQVWVKAYFNKMLLCWFCFTEIVLYLWDLVIALELFQDKDIFSVSAITHSVFKICNTAASTDTVKRKVIESKRFTPRSNFSLLYNWNWSTGTKQAIWKQKQTHRKKKH